MICPSCCCPDTRTLSTRLHEHGVTVRQHACECGHRFRSVQVLEDVYRSGALPEIKQLPRAPRKPPEREYRRRTVRVELPDTAATWMRGL